MSIPTTEHETIQLHRSSQADADSDNSSPGPKNSAFSDARDSVELHTLLRTSIENGNPLSQQSGEAVSQGESDEDEEDGKDIQSRSGISDLSESYTQQEERAIVRKFDRRLVLFMALLYLLSFLDRSNIGNARIAGLESGLSLQPGQYAWLLTAFYITYISFEWMTLLYRLIPPHIYITLCVLSWGLIASLQSISTSFSTLLIFRALLGIAEAAFGPGVPFYLSFFYKRSELAYRVGLFISAAPLATSCASTLAWLIVKLSQHGPLEPWRALFLVEGFPSIIVAIFAWHIIPDCPSTAKYLTSRERKIAKLRLQHDEPSPKTTTTRKTHRLSLTDLLTTITDPKAYLTSLMFFSANISFSSLPVFLPTIINSMSTPSTTSTSSNNTTISPLLSQLLTAPPYLISFLLVLLLSHLSDTIPNSRAYFLILSALLSSLSYTLLTLVGLFHTSPLLTTHPTLLFLMRYTPLFPACAGFFTSIVLIITWTLNNQRTTTGRGTGVVLLNVVGQMGPLVGVRLFPEDDAPWFVRGLGVSAACMAGVAGLAAGLRCWLRRLNRREAQRESERWGREGVELEELGAGEEEVGEDRAGAGEGLIRRRKKGREREKKFEYIL